MRRSHARRRRSRGRGPWRRVVLHLPGRWRRRLWVVLVGSSAVLLAATGRIDRQVAGPLPALRLPAYSEAAVQRGSRIEGSLDLDEAPFPVAVRIERGQTLGRALIDHGLTPPEAYRLAAELGEHLDVRRIRPGDPCLAYFDAAGRISRVRLAIDRRGWVTAERHGGAWRTEVHEFRRRTEVRAIRGELQGFLETAVERAGGRPLLAYRMGDVLQWDLDFNRDLRVGDRFAAVFEELYLDGRFAEVGEVLALLYESRGRRYEAYRFEDGYYDADGRPLRKMFLRSPLRFSRVTSRFSNRRFHPILKRYRPHHGVDYGAPQGTPVRVTANGTVLFAGWDGGGGKTVKVRHPNGFVTAYLHLSRFGTGVRSGRRVRQGEVIGYVGATGLATGPHLDYRVRRGGRWIDPLSMKSLPAEPIPGDRMADFSDRRDALRRLLEPASEPMKRTAVGLGEPVGPPTPERAPIRLSR